MAAWTGAARVVDAVGGVQEVQVDDEPAVQARPEVDAQGAVVQHASRRAGQPAAASVAHRDPEPAAVPVEPPDGELAPGRGQHADLLARHGPGQAARRRGQHRHLDAPERVVVGHLEPGEAVAVRRRARVLGEQAVARRHPAAVGDGRRALRAHGGVQARDLPPPVELVEHAGHLSMSPTTKKNEHSAGTRSARRVPGSTAGSAETFENDAVRIASRHGTRSPRDTSV